MGMIGGQEYLGPEARGPRVFPTNLTSPESLLQYLTLGTWGRVPPGTKRESLELRAPVSHSMLKSVHQSKDRNGALQQHPIPGDINPFHRDKYTPDRY